jgi:hypothetical protein
MRTAAVADEHAKGGHATRFRRTSLEDHHAVGWTVTTFSDSGYPLGQRETYIRHGSEAAIVTCQWRRDGGQQPHVERGCDDFMQTFHFTS